MKNRRLLLLFFLGLSLSACTTLSEPRSSSAFKSLFNGKDSKDWIVKIFHHPVGDNYGNTFRVEDGMIKVRYDQYEQFNNRYGHLYYQRPYSHFHLVVEYRFADEWRKDAPSYTILNSGVMYHSQDPRSMPVEQDWPISVEMQFLAGLGDGKPRPTGNMCSPGTDVIFKGKKDPRHCIDSSSKTYGKDEWVRAELVVLGDSLITHLINGEVVLQYANPSIGGGVANGYDPKIKIDGKPLKAGYIALQSEGQPIDFRKVEIRDLSKMKQGSALQKNYAELLKWE
jgi:Domain of Unknown Function (DUF1080)